MSKIVNTAFPEDDEIGIDKISVTYVQNPDTNNNSEHYQLLTLTSESVPGIEDGNTLPYYINVSIEDFEDGTKGHWSIEPEGNELNDIISDFVQRLKTTTTK